MTRQLSTGTSVPVVTSQIDSKRHFVMPSQSYMFEQLQIHKGRSGSSYWDRFQSFGNLLSAHSVQNPVWREVLIRYWTRSLVRMMYRIRVFVAVPRRGLASQFGSNEPDRHLSPQTAYSTIHKKSKIWCRGWVWHANPDPTSRNGSSYP
jgi:hypothetical protein